MRKLAEVIFVLLCCMASAHASEEFPDASEINPMITMPSSGPRGSVDYWSQGFPVSIGYRFHVNQDIIVNALGATEQWSPTVGNTYHFLFIWDTNGNKLARVNLFNGPEEYGQPPVAVGAYTFMGIPDLLLTKGDYYITGTNFLRYDKVTGFPIFVNGIETDPAITITGRYSGSANGIPSLSSTRSDPVAMSHIYAGVTFSAVLAVPEPETYAMLIAGLLLVGYAAVKRRS